jgi:5-formyltetrahydrofolate cyclo-ligase
LQSAAHAKSNLAEMKIEMRQRILTDLKKMSADQAREKSEAIQKNLENHLQSQSGLWAAYIAMPTEPQLDWSEVSEKIQWCFPVIAENKLVFKKSVHQFKHHALGFQEPVDGEVVELTQIKGVVVPGLAFGKNGHRLGRGRGFYDQTLENYKGSIVGVCYQASLQDSVPVEDHDLKCQFVITDEKSVAVNG